MRRLDDSSPEPFHIRFSPGAIKQVAALAAAARERLSRRLLQLADLAAFATSYSITVSHVESLLANTEEVWIKYEVDDVARTLTVVELGDAPPQSCVRELK